jgi:hypothetical protein
MHNPAKQLRKLFPNAPGQFQFHYSDAVNTMVLCRELIELHKLAATYDVLNLYCNWTVHTELTGSRCGFNVLRTVAAAPGPNHQQAALADAVSERFSIVKLRHQMVSLFKRFHVPLSIVDSIKGWEIFGSHFFKSLMFKRLRFPNDAAHNERSAQIFSAMQADAAGDPARMVLSIYLRDDLVPPNRVHWVVELGNGQEVTGELKNLEKRENFGLADFVAIVVTPKAPAPWRIIGAWAPSRRQARAKAHRSSALSPSSSG